MGEIGFLAVLAATAAFYFSETMGYTVSRFERTGGAGIYPQVVLTALGLMIALRLVQIIIARGRAPFRILTIVRGSRGVFFLSFVAYVLLIDWLGFIVAGSLFLTGVSGFIYFVGNGGRTIGGWKYVTLRSIGLTALAVFLDYMFVRHLNVRIPAGLLGF